MDPLVSVRRIASRDPSPLPPPPCRRGGARSRSAQDLLRNAPGSLSKTSGFFSPACGDCQGVFVRGELSSILRWGRGSLRAFRTPRVKVVRWLVVWCWSRWLWCTRRVEASIAGITARGWVRGMRTRRAWVDLMGGACRLTWSWRRATTAATCSTAGHFGPPSIWDTIRSREFCTRANNDQK